VQNIELKNQSLIDTDFDILNIENTIVSNISCENMGCFMKSNYSQIAYFKKSEFYNLKSKINAGFLSLIDPIAFFIQNCSF
jgi:hypothetical protein